MKPTALITGVSRGIGKEFANQLVARGYFVIGTCRDSNCNSIKNCLAIELLDVQNDDAILTCAKKYKNTPIDLLINNAGVLYADAEKAWGEDLTTIGSFSRSDIRQTLEINTISPLKVTEAFIPHLLKSKQKTIVAISSGAGSIAENKSGGMTAYRMSKAALNMGMQEFAIKLSNQGVYVLLLHPGWVQTSMGGPAASITVKESVAGMLNVIEKKENFISGNFYDYQGASRPF